MADETIDKRPSRNSGWFDLPLELREHIIDEVLEIIVEEYDGDESEEGALRRFAGVSYKLSQQNLQRPLKMAQIRLQDTMAEQSVKCDAAMEEVEAIRLKHDIFIEPPDLADYNNWKAENICEEEGCSSCSLLRPSLDIVEHARGLRERVNRQWWIMFRYTEMSKATASKREEQQLRESL